MTLSAAHCSAQVDNYWESVPGQIDASVTALAIDADGRIYAGTHERGVVSSTDRGRTWSLAGAGLPPITIESLAVGPEGQVVAGTSNMSAGTNQSGAVFRSTDRGRNWTATNRQLTTNSVRAVRYDREGRLYAGGGWGPGGVFVSTNDGDNWQQSSLRTGIVLTLSLNDAGHVFAGTENDGIFVSIDHAQTWTAINQGLPINGNIWGIGFGKNGRLFAGKTGTGGSGDGVFQLLPNAPWQATTHQFRKCTGMTVAPNGDILAGSMNEVMLSRDAGATWLPTNASGPVTAFAVAPDGFLYMSNARGGVRRSVKPVATILPKSTPSKKLPPRKTPAKKST